MSLERRKPFAHLQPNAKPVEAAAAHPTISRPRRQMAAYHYHHQLQHNPHKRYATMFPGSSRSSATSSAESVYSITNNSMQPRRRKLSAAEDVAARVRARWAALEALERTSASVSASPQPAEAISGIATSAAGIRTGARMDPRVPEQQSPYSVLAPPDHELDRANDKENENAALWMMQQMQVDGQSQDEKPLPPRPAALGLRINPSSEPAHALASAATTMAVPMVLDTRNDRDDATPRNDESAPMSDSTLRTTPTSMTCFEMGSLRPVLQRRPTRALTPPQVRRRPSITDELEAAVRSLPSSSLPHTYSTKPLPSMWRMFAFLRNIDAIAERGSYADDATKFAHGWPAAMSTTGMQRAAQRRACAHVPLAHPRSKRRGSIYVRAVRWWV